MNTSAPVVGVLSLQGDYQKHQAALDSLAIPSLAVRRAEDFDRIDRLIIPGGESTTIVKLLRRLEMETALIKFIRTRPVWGTCAGMVLLADRVNDDSIKPYRAIDISVDRNGYGRQIASTVIPSALNLNGHREELNLVFIRAPRVTRVGSDVRKLLNFNDEPVLMSQGQVLVSSFHPELSASSLLHNYFARKFVLPETLRQAGRGK